MSKKVVAQCWLQNQWAEAALGAAVTSSSGYSKHRTLTVIHLIRYNKLHFHLCYPELDVPTCTQEARKMQASILTQ